MMMNHVVHTAQLHFLYYKNRNVAKRSRIGQLSVILKGH